MSKISKTLDPSYMFKIEMDDSKLFECITRVKQTITSLFGPKAWLDIKFLSGIHIDPSGNDRSITYNTLNEIYINISKEVYLDSFMQILNNFYDSKIEGHVIKIKGIKNDIINQEPSKTLTVIVEGGCVQDILNIPEGYDYTIQDYDNEDHSDSDYNHDPPKENVPVLSEEKVPEQPKENVSVPPETKAPEEAPKEKAPEQPEQKIQEPVPQSENNISFASKVGDNPSAVVFSPVQKKMTDTVQKTLEYPSEYPFIKKSGHVYGFICGNNNEMIYISHKSLEILIGQYVTKAQFAYHFLDKTKCHGDPLLMKQHMFKRMCDGKWNENYDPERDAYFESLKEPTFIEGTLMSMIDPQENEHTNHPYRCVYAGTCDPKIIKSKITQIDRNGNVTMDLSESINGITKAFSHVDWFIKNKEGEEMNIGDEVESYIKYENIETKNSLYCFGMESYYEE